MVDGVSGERLSDEAAISPVLQKYSVFMAIHKSFGRNCFFEQLTVVRWKSRSYTSMVCWL